MKLTLYRLGYSAKETTGRLVLEGHISFSWATLELPDLNNGHDKSCIPAGVYHCVKTFSTHLGYTCPELQNVPGRTSIRIHKANFKSQLLGCIAIGQEFADIDKDGLTDVTSSTLAFTELMKNTPDEFDLEIIENK
jgi:hypothetical protein